MRLVLDIGSTCSRIACDAKLIRTDVDFAKHTDRLTMADCDLLTAERQLWEALTAVRAALADRPHAIEEQAEIDARVDRLVTGVA